MTEKICEHGSQKRKCPHCELIALDEAVADVLESMRKIDETQCSTEVWNTIVDAIDTLEEL